MPLSSSSSLFLCHESPDDVVSWDSDEWAPLETAAGRPISLLLAAEADFMPPLESLSRILLHRQNAVNWILKVNEFYRFRQVTAFIAVNYLDRFLSSNKLPGQNGESGWPMQLLSVACVAVAAKMEETHVPLLSDLQILDPKFVFESKTIMRMELLLMSALNWRMRPVTPFDFVGYFADLVKPELIAGSRAGLISRAADLIVKTCRVVDCFGYRMSEIAAAAIICAVKKIANISADECTDLLRCFNEWVNEETLKACLQLMEDSFMGTRPCSQSAKPLLEARIPQSPIGVIDAAACKSCDSHMSSSSTMPENNFSPIEIPAKRRRVFESLRTRCVDDESKKI